MSIRHTAAALAAAAAAAASSHAGATAMPLLSWRGGASRLIASSSWAWDVERMDRGAPHTSASSAAGQPDTGRGGGGGQDRSGSQLIDRIVENISSRLDKGEFKLPDKPSALTSSGSVQYDYTAAPPGVDIEQLRKALAGTLTAAQRGLPLGRGQEHEAQLRSSREAAKQLQENLAKVPPVDELAEALAADNPAHVVRSKLAGLLRPFD